MEYYDYVLVLVPFALFGLAGLLAVLGVGLSSAVPLAGVVSAGVVGHAMFVRPPVAAPRLVTEGGAR